MGISESGIAFIKRWEGFVPHAYDDTDPKARPIKPGDPVRGVLTYGYGETAGVKPGDTITESEADRRLRMRVKFFEKAVKDAVSVTVKQHQFDAMVSLCYNIGPERFRGSSVVRFLNAGDDWTAGQKFLLWRKQTINGRLVEVPGLLRRRRAEREMFYGKGYGE